MPWTSSGSRSAKRVAMDHTLLAVTIVLTLVGLVMVFSATKRPMKGSLPLYTTPMAPRPSSSMTSYLPIFCAMEFAAAGRGAEMGLATGGRATRVRATPRAYVTAYYAKLA